jgi:quercetin dioxygenase-like cupin family protein
VLERRAATKAFVQAVCVIDDHERTLATGDCFVVHPGVRHGIEGVAPRTHRIDAFAPPIARYDE